MKSRFTVPALVCCLLCGIETTAQEMCDDYLTTGKATPPGTAPPEADPPDISNIVIQVWTTRPLDELVTTAATPQTHKCALAGRLAEVDVMAEDIGFAGYDGTNAPLFNNAYVQYVDNAANRQIIRDVAFQIIHPAGDAEEALDEFKNNAEVYTSGVLNIYYLHYGDTSFSSFQDYEPIEIRGMHIRDENGYSEKMIFFDDAAVPGTLAHEFGHALSGGHVNFEDLEGVEWCTKFLPQPSTPAGLPNMECEFTRQNIMWAGSSEDVDRHILGDPQKERMLRNEKSVMRDFHAPVSKLDCPDTNANLANGCARLKEF